MPTITIKLPTGIYEYDPQQTLGVPGSFGEVFRGRSSTGANVAVKKLNIDAESVAHREMDIATELRGKTFEFVMQFIDAGEDAESGFYFVVMPIADESLQDRLDACRLVDSVSAIGIMLEIARGLVEVGGLVHRDLKPANVLWHDGRWKVADFGISKFVDSATSDRTLKFSFTPLFAAPEQWKYETATHATDVYALGCIGFMLLAGAPPFTENLEDSHRYADPPEIPCDDSRLRSLIMMMLRKAPQARPSLQRVVERLHGARQPLPSPVGADAFRELADVGARALQEELRAENAALARVAEREDREGQALEAGKRLFQNLSRLWKRISDNAPTAVASPADDARLELRLGLGLLGCDLGNFVTMNREQPTWPGGDVMTGVEFCVAQQDPKYRWSSTLCYARLPGASEYRWVEVAFYAPRGTNVEQPLSILPTDERFKHALIREGILPYSVAYGPWAIDDESEDEFHARVAWLISRAAGGGLKRPTTFPIRDWPPT